MFTQSEEARIRQLLGSLEVSDLFDVPDPTDGTALFYSDSSGYYWDSAGAGISNIADAGDTNISTPASLEILQYLSGKFANVTLDSAGIQLASRSANRAVIDSDYTGATDAASDVSTAITAWSTAANDEIAIAAKPGTLLLESGVSAEDVYGFRLEGAGKVGLFYNATQGNRSVILADPSFSGDALLTLRAIDGCISDITFAGNNLTDATDTSYDGYAPSGIDFEAANGFGSGQLLLNQVGFWRLQKGFDAGADGYATNASDCTFINCTFRECQSALYTSHQQALNYTFIRPMVNWCEDAFHLYAGGSINVSGLSTYDTDRLIYAGAGGKNTGWLLLHNTRIDTAGANAPNGNGVRCELIYEDTTGQGGFTAAAFSYISQISDTTPTHTVAYDTGSTEITRGMMITGGTSGALGYVQNITLDSGTWAGGDAAGTITYNRRNNLTFSNGEDIEVASTKYAEAAGDTGDALGRIRIRGNSLVELHGGYNLCGDIGDTYDAGGDIDQGPLIDFLDGGILDSIFVCTLTQVTDGVAAAIGYETTDHDGWYLFDSCYTAQNQPMKRTSNALPWATPCGSDYSTKGDIVVGSGSGDGLDCFETIGVGTNGQVLTANSAVDGGVEWAAYDHGALTGLADDDHTQYLLAAGTRGLSADWDAGSHEIRAETFESDVATGTAPFTVASTTLVSNLNVERVGGVKHFGALASASEPATGMANGDMYFNTTLNETMYYDGTRSKWLSVATYCVQAAYNSPTVAVNTYLRFMNGIQGTSTRGGMVPKGTLVGTTISLDNDDDPTPGAEDVSIRIYNNGSGLGAPTDWDIDMTSASGKYSEKWDWNLDHDAGNLTPRNISGTYSNNLNYPVMHMFTKRRA